MGTFSKMIQAFSMFVCLCASTIYRTRYIFNLLKQYYHVSIS